MFASVTVRADKEIVFCYGESLGSHGSTESSLTGLAKVKGAGGVQARNNIGVPILVIGIV